jgi:hypothetical protein
VNHLVDAVRADVGLEHGISLPVWHALAAHNNDLSRLAEEAAAGQVTFRLPEGAEAELAAKHARDADGSSLTARSGNSSNLLYSCQTHRLAVFTALDDPDTR